MNDLNFSETNSLLYQSSSAYKSEVLEMFDELSLQQGIKVLVSLPVLKYT